MASIQYVHGTAEYLSVLTAAASRGEVLIRGQRLDSGGIEVITDTREVRETMRQQHARREVA